jgi:hypothetical protein
MQPAKRFSREHLTIAKTPAPASTLFLCPLPSHPACCSRGQVTGYFANSLREIATARPTVNAPNVLILQVWDIHY